MEIKQEDLLRFHDDHQAKAAIVYAAGVIEATKHLKPDLTVDDVLTLLCEIASSYRDGLYRRILP